MSEVKKASKLEKVLEDHHYPSSVDNLVRNDTPYEGTADSMPAESPVFGVTKLPTHKISKVK